MTKISASIVADSICNGHRITTMLLTYPRFIHSEMCRHRMQSRNTASSRAIPLKKMIEAIQTDPVIPIAWQKHHAGMQGTEYFPLDGFTAKEGVSAQHLNDMWLSARDVAIKQALEYEKLNVTKQLINRLLEPWMWTVELVTATEWENFYHLRCPQYRQMSSYSTYYRRSKKDYFKNIGLPDEPENYKSWSNVDWLQINKGQAEIHMMALAEAMWDAKNESTPKALKPGEWHTPYGDKVEFSKTSVLGDTTTYIANPAFKEELDIIIKVATAKAAQTSYTVVSEDGKPTSYEKLIALHDRLLASGHFSCFEHCAQAMYGHEYKLYIRGKCSNNSTESEDLIIAPVLAEGWCHNLNGWKSYRSMIPNESSQ